MDDVVKLKRKSKEIYVCRLIIERVQVGTKAKLCISYGLRSSKFNFFFYDAT